MTRIAKDANPDAKVVGEWDADYWKHEPGRGPQHMAVVKDKWRTRCACSGCPECWPKFVENATREGWMWEPAACWGDAVCQGCDTLICEQPRLGLWVKGDRRLCGACLTGGP